MPDPLKLRYSPELISKLAATIQSEYEPFDAQGFIKQVLSDPWNDLELKERMTRITLSMHQFLPNDFRKALDILMRVAERFDGFLSMYFPEFVERFGMDDWEVSLPALAHFTSYSSSEFAIRPFILRDATRTMAQIELWAESDNEHVRRLASEGCRPRLPWAQALPDFKKDPMPVIRVLEKLKDDPSEYVRRSVANNLNDISKDNPEAVTGLLKKWQKAESKDMTWLVRHALRSLIKQGHPQALELIGFSPEVDISVDKLSLTPDPIHMGSDLSIHLELSNPTPSSQNLLVDYLIYFVKANGTLKPKTFKWTQKIIAENSMLTLDKKHKFREISTRRYYPGQHELHIQINGTTLAKKSFTLLLRET